MQRPRMPEDEPVLSHARFSLELWGEADRVRHPWGRPPMFQAVDFLLNPLMRTDLSHY